ncbi:MAG: polyphenol oxidase family protein [Polyangiaceae bacterium]
MSRPSPLTSPLLLAHGFTHGFFTREGGCSSGAFTSLNCSYGVGDAPENVARNLGRVSATLNLDPRRLVTVSQVHGASVVEYRESCDVEDFHRIEADAMVSGSSRHGLAIRTADCLPVLVGCRTTGRAAAIHAGWRGIVAEVIPRAIDHLIASGSEPKALVAAIGPHIGVDAFEVSDDVAPNAPGNCPRVFGRHSRELAQATRDACQARNRRNSYVLVWRRQPSKPSTAAPTRTNEVFSRSAVTVSPRGDT